MADSAQWLVAAEAAAGLPDGTFVRALEAVPEDMMMEKAMHDPVVIAIVELLGSRGRQDPSKRRFDGTVAELYGDLPQPDRYNRNLPPTPAHLSTTLKRLVPAMNKIGIFVEFGKKTRKGKPVHIWVEGEFPLIDPDAPVVPYQVRR